MASNRVNSDEINRNSGIKIRWVPKKRENSDEINRMEE